MRAVYRGPRAAHEYAVVEVEVESERRWITLNRTTGQALKSYGEVLTFGSPAAAAQNLDRWAAKWGFIRLGPWKAAQGEAVNGVYGSGKPFTDKNGGMDADA